MGTSKNKRSVILALFAFFLVVVLVGPNVAEAASITIPQNGTKTYSVGSAGEKITVTLSGAYTSVVLQGRPSWISSTKSGSKFTLTVQKNDAATSRKGDVVFRDGTKLWTLRITQSAAPTVTVKFDNNGGSGSIPNKTYVVGNKYGSLPAGPTPPTGYTFAGWYTARSGGTRITTASTASSSYKTLYAHYTAKTLTVSFNSDGGTAVSNRTVTYGSTYGTLTNPTKTNYTFQGWYTSSGARVTPSTIVSISVNHTLTARWTRNTVTVKFDNNGGSGSIPNKTFYVGDKYTGLPAGPTPPNGYNFDGWFTARSGGTKITASSTVSASYTTLFAHYTAKTLTVSFNSDGGTAVSNRTVTYGSTYGTLTNPTKTNYTFQGWYTSSGARVTPSTVVSVSANHTLTARWTRDTVTVKFDTNGGGGSIPNKTFNVGDKYTGLPAGPTPPQGYNFDGWFTAKSGGTKITASSIVSASYTTLFAHYSAKTLRVSFDSDGGTPVSDKDVVFGKSYGDLTTPTKEYYTFSGWYTTSGANVISTTVVSLSVDHTLYARWTRNTANVSFDVNGGYGIIPNQSFYEGETYVNLPVGPTPSSGYKFKGWYTAKTGGTKVDDKDAVIMSQNTLYAQYCFDISFSDTELQSKIKDDVWVEEETGFDRTGYLTSFYDGLLNGADNTVNPVATRFVVNRAKEMTVFSWSPAFAVTGYRGDSSDTKRDFNVGQTYYGLPYQQTDQGPKDSEEQKGYTRKTSIYYHYGSKKTQDEFIEYAKTEEFSKRRDGYNGSYKYCYSLGPKCGIDCSSFVSYCVGATEQQSSSTLHDKLENQDIDKDSVNNLMPGDVLWKKGHVVLVASVYKEGETVKGLVVLESRGRTTASGRNLHVFYDSDQALSKLFGDMSISDCSIMLQNLLYVENDNLEEEKRDYSHFGDIDNFIASFSTNYTILKINTQGSGIGLEEEGIFR